MSHTDAITKLRKLTESERDKDTKAAIHCFLDLLELHFTNQARTNDLLDTIDSRLITLEFAANASRS